MTFGALLSRFAARVNQSRNDYDDEEEGYTAFLAAHAVFNMEINVRQLAAVLCSNQLLMILCSLCCDDVMQPWLLRFRILREEHAASLGLTSSLRPKTPGTPGVYGNRSPAYYRLKTGDGGNSSRAIGKHYEATPPLHGGRALAEPSVQMLLNAHQTRVQLKVAEYESRLQTVSKRFVSETRWLPGALSYSVMCMRCFHVSRRRKRVY